LVSTTSVLFSQAERVRRAAADAAARAWMDLLIFSQFAGAATIVKAFFASHSQ
jgi:hypothetical protein